MILSEFLLARIDEDENIARRAEKSPGSYRGHPAGTAPLWTASAASVHGHEVGPRGSVEATPGRVLTECAAKRRIVVQLADLAGRCPPDDWPEEGGMDVAALADHARWLLRVMTAVYADHPDFDPAWRLD